MLVTSTDGVAAPLPEVVVSALALRFLADFESTGTVPAVDMVTADPRSVAGSWGVRSLGVKRRVN